MTIDFNQFDEELLDQASAWIARLRSDQVSDADKQDFALWLAQSQQHKQAFDEMLLLWHGMGRADQTSEEIVAGILQATMAGAPINPSNDGFSASRTTTVERFDNHISQANQKTSKRSGANLENWIITAAACLALVGVLLFYNLKPSDTAAEYFYSSFQTRKGEQKTVTLPDGSIVELNTNTKVEVSFSNQQRQLVLEKGEAYFEVAPNQEVPFIVSAGAGRITALGTAFNIYREGRNTVVTVTEGTVSVVDTLNMVAANANEQTLTVGQAIEVDASEGLSAVKAANEKQALAWRQKTLVFDQTELVSALAELNRYLLVPVDYSHPSMTDPNLKISGTFRLEEPETTLTAIINTFSLKVEHDSKSDLIKLSAPARKI